MTTPNQRAQGSDQGRGSAARSSTAYPLLLVVLCGAPLMASLDLFVVNVAFPAIGEDFSGSSLGGLSWILTSYAIVYAALLIPLGRWADTVGARRVFLLGLAVFTAGSLAAAVSTALPLLIASRAAQAIGAAALTPTSLGLLITTVQADRRPRAVRLWVTSSALGSALGPLIGGLLVELSWRWVFIVNLPIGGALIALAAIGVPAKDATAAAAGRVNLLGATVAAVAAGALCLALVEGGAWGWSSARTLISLGVSAGAALALVIDSIKNPAPLVPAAVMRVRSFAGANAAITLFSGTFAAGLLALSLWLHDVWQYSALQTGLALAPGPLMVPAVALGAERVLGRVSPATRAAAGSLLWAAGALVMLLADPASPNYTGGIVLPGWLLAGVGVGLALPTILAAATADLPAAFASVGSAVVNVTRQLGTVIGISVLVAILGHGGAAQSAFQAAWWTIAAIGVLAAFTALRLPRTEPTTTSGN